jgi:hypothetical protein
MTKIQKKQKIQNSPTRYCFIIFFFFMHGSFVILSHVMEKLCFKIYPISQYPWNANNKKITKLNQSHTTLTFNWFPQYEVHSLAEVITNKFIMKEYKIVVKKSLRTQSPNTLKSSYHATEIILQRIIQKTKKKKKKLFFCQKQMAANLYFSLSL